MGDMVTTLLPALKRSLVSFAISPFLAVTSRLLLVALRKGRAPAGLCLGRELGKRLVLSRGWERLRGPGGFVFLCLQSFYREKLCGTSQPLACGTSQPLARAQTQL